METNFDDVLWPSFDFFKATYEKIAWPIKPRIDYIFHSPVIRCIDAEVIQKSHGDHYPVWAMFDLS